MSENRESKIFVKGANFNESDTKLEIAFKLNFGKEYCSQKMEEIKAMGVDPSSNAIVVTHEFETEEAAKSFVEVLTSLKEMIPPLAMIESISNEGNKLIGYMHIPPEAAGPLAMLEPLAASMGDFASKHQSIEFKVMDSRSLKEIFSDPAVSPAAMGIDALGVKFSLSLNKELPTKIASFVASMAPDKKSQIELAGEAFATFHHFNLEIELREPTEMMKGAFKDQIGMFAGMGAMQATGLAEQFGMKEALKRGGVKTSAMLCLSPLLALEFSIYAPTAIETLEKLASGSD